MVIRYLEKMDALMNEWKAVGFAGKQYDEELWHSFSEVRKEFQQKKREHHEELMKLFEDRANKKEEMIKLAKQILADSDFSDEEVKKVALSLENVARQTAETGIKKIIVVKNRIVNIVA